jgi:hypothetical protein
VVKYSKGELRICYWLKNEIKDGNKSSDHDDGKSDVT